MNPYGMVRPQGLFGGLRGLTKGATFSGFLDGAQKTLGIINQAIPIVNQVGPMISNARTMFRIADVMKEDDSRNSTTNFRSTNTINNSINASTNNQVNKPIFYI